MLILDESGTPVAAGADPDELGPKAWHLHRVAERLGAQAIPRSLCVPASLIRRAIAEDATAAAICRTELRRTRRGRMPDERAAEAAARAIERFMAPRLLAVARVLGGGPYAVRSSGSEDEPDNVNAGGNRTRLDVPRRALAEAVGFVGASLFAARSLRQRMLAGVALPGSLAELRLAVLIQEMVGGGAGQGAPVLSDAVLARVLSLVEGAAAAFPRGAALDFELAVGGAAAASVVAFNRDPDTGRRRVILDCSGGTGTAVTGAEAATTSLRCVRDREGWLALEWRRAPPRVISGGRVVLTQARPQAKRSKVAAGQLQSSPPPRARFAAEVLVPGELRSSGRAIVAWTLDEAWRHYLDDRRHVGLVAVCRGNRLSHPALMFAQARQAVLRVGAAQLARLTALAGAGAGFTWTEGELRAHDAFAGGVTRVFAEAEPWRNAEPRLRISGGGAAEQRLRDAPLDAHERRAFLDALASQRSSPRERDLSAIGAALRACPWAGADLMARFENAAAPAARVRRARALLHDADPEALVEILEGRRPPLQRNLYYRRVDEFDVEGKRLLAGVVDGTVEPSDYAHHLGRWWRWLSGVREARSAPQARTLGRLVRASLPRLHERDPLALLARRWNEILARPPTRVGAHQLHNLLHQFALSRLPVFAAGRSSAFAAELVTFGNAFKAESCCLDLATPEVLRFELLYLGVHSCFAELTARGWYFQFAETYSWGAGKNARLLVLEALLKRLAARRGFTVSTFLNESRLESTLHAECSFPGGAAFCRTAGDIFRAVSGWLDGLWDMSGTPNRAVARFVRLVERGRVDALMDAAAAYRARFTTPVPDWRRHPYRRFWSVVSEFVRVYEPLLAHLDDDRLRERMQRMQLRPAHRFARRRATLRLILAMV